MSDPGSLREGRHQPDPSFVFLRSLSAGSEGWREGRQAEARLDRGRADAEGSPRKRQLPRAIHAGTKAAAARSQPDEAERPFPERSPVQAQT